MKYANVYALGTQGILSIAILSVGGFLIGYYAINSLMWAIILAIIGLICGFFSLMVNLLYIAKKQDRERQKVKNNDESSVSEEKTEESDR